MIMNAEAADAPRGLHTASGPDAKTCNRLLAHLLEQKMAELHRMMVQDEDTLEVKPVRAAALQQQRRHACRQRLLCARVRSPWLATGGCSCNF